METPEERDRQHEDERDAWQHEQDRIDRFADIPRDPTAVAEMILEAPLRVELTPRQIGRLISMVSFEKGRQLERGDHGEADACEFILEQLTRAVAQIGARP